MAHIDECSTKILIVDDDVRLGQLIGRFLRERGFSTFIVFDGSELDNLIQHHVFDLIVLDVCLPGETGWQILRRLRDAGNTTPILIMTAFSNHDSHIRTAEQGADGFISKPFAPTQLIK